MSEHSPTSTSRAGCTRRVRGPATCSPEYNPTVDAGPNRVLNQALSLTGMCRQSDPVTLNKLGRRANPFAVGTVIRLQQRRARARFVHCIQSQ